jgi:hypothetical protein
MNRILAFEVLLFVVLVAAALLGYVGLERVGQVILGIGLIELVLSLLAWAGWPVLRGDISGNRALTKQDSRETARDDPSSIDHDRASRAFAIQLALAGVLATGMGVILIFFAP